MAEEGWLEARAGRLQLERAIGTLPKLALAYKQPDAGELAELIAAKMGLEPIQFAKELIEVRGRLAQMEDKVAEDARRRLREKALAPFHRALRRLRALREKKSKRLAARALQMSAAIRRPERAAQSVRYTRAASRTCTSRRNHEGGLQGAEPPTPAEECVP